MRLKRFQKPWMSEDGRYLEILWESRGYQLPTDWHQQLLDQANLMEILVKRANKGEIAEVNLWIQDSLTESMLDFLPDKLMFDPDTPKQLMFNPASMGTNLQEWKAELGKALKGPPATPEEIKEAFEDLRIGSYLNRIL